MSKREVVVGIFAAVFGFLGALGGSYLSGVVDQNNWEARYQTEHKNKLVERRFKIIEELLELYVKMPLASADIIRVESNAKISQMVVDCLELANDKGIKDPDCSVGSDSKMKLYREIAKDVYSLKAEVESKLLMANLMFGPKTKQAIVELTSAKNYKWHSPDKQSINRLIFTMYGEISL